MAVETGVSAGESCGAGEMAGIRGAVRQIGRVRARDVLDEIAGAGNSPNCVLAAGISRNAVGGCAQ